MNNIKVANIIEESKLGGPQIRIAHIANALKDIVDTLSQDNIIGHMVNYFSKNMEDIIMGAPMDKKQRMLSTDPYAMKE